MKSKKGENLTEFWVLDDTLRLSIKYENQDRDLQDNVCLSIYESCPEDEKLFIADETNIYLTTAEAAMVAEALLTAVQKSRGNHEK